MNPQQIHALWACSLLAIPPPTERTPPLGGFPTDLSELNLLGWAALVQDVVAGLQVVPPNLGRDMGLPVVALLQLLEATTGVGFCHYCCKLGSWCKCMGAYQLAPPKSWSQIVEQTPGYGVTASSEGMTTPSTTVAGMPGYVAPLPGLTPPDFSSWSLPPPEAPLSQGLPAASQGLPGIGRSTLISGAVERHARAQLVLVYGPQPNELRCHLRQHCALPRWHHLSISHHLARQQLHTSRQYSREASLLGRESLSTPPPTKLPLLAVKALRTVEDRGPEYEEMVANLPVTPGERKRRQVGRHLIWRVIFPQGKHQTFPKLQHLKVLCLNGAVG